MLQSSFNGTAKLPLTVRMRRSPFWERSNAAGAQGYIVYNHMLIATGFVGPEEDYRHLKSAVQVWDVGVERQIEISGPDAAKLVQMSTPRDLARMKDDQCYYIPTVDRDGCMTNDPVLLRLEADRYWVSISDSDLILFYKGVAAALNLNVEVFEPDVYPLAIQGPKADDLAAKLWGDQVRELRFFRQMPVHVNGKPMILARSGYSVQGGFELYFEGRDGAEKLWDELMEAGRDLDVRAGTPCQAERVEAGMLSYLSDITQDMTPFEAGLGSMCAMDQNPGCLGWSALRKKQSPSRQIRAVEISGGPLPPQKDFWLVSDGDRSVGRISSSCRAYDFDCNAGIGLIDASHWTPGTKVQVHTSDGPRAATIKEKFWGRF